MTTLRSVLCAFVAVLIALGPHSGGPVRAQDASIDIQVFYQELEPHGRWFEHPRYGFVWSPDVDDAWRPYSLGQWVYTEENGWYWESDEPFGWAVYHYGRWFLDDEFGWVWVPGTEWAPAWVAWRNSDEQVGWAPLPPEAEWQDGTLNFSSSYYDSPRFSPIWCFVPVAYLAAPRVYRYLAPPARNAFYLRSTRWVPGYRYIDRRIVNFGFDRYRYERLTNRRLAPVRIQPIDRPRFDRRGAPGAVQVFRPRVTGTTARIPPPRLVEPPRRGAGRPGYGREGAPPQPSILRPAPQPRRDGPPPSAGPQPNFRDRGGPPAGQPNFGGGRPQPPPQQPRFQAVPQQQPRLNEPPREGRGGGRPPQQIQQRQGPPPGGANSAPRAQPPQQQRSAPRSNPQQEQTPSN